MKNMTERYSRAGIIMEPSIPLHISSWSICCSIPDEYTAECAASCMRKFTR